MSASGYVHGYLNSDHGEFALLKINLLTTCSVATPASVAFPRSAAGRRLAGDPRRADDLQEQGLHGLVNAVSGTDREIEAGGSVALLSNGCCVGFGVFTTKLIQLKPDCRI